MIAIIIGNDSRRVVAQEYTYIYTSLVIIQMLRGCISPGYSHLNISSTDFTLVLVHQNKSKLMHLDLLR